MRARVCACVGAWVRGCVGAWVRGCVGARVRGRARCAVCGRRICVFFLSPTPFHPSYNAGIPGLLKLLQPVTVPLNVKWVDCHLDVHIRILTKK